MKVSATEQNGTAAAYASRVARSLSSGAHSRDPLAYPGRRMLIRRQRDLIVDQAIQRRLHVDFAVDDAGLLQREAGGKDRFALRCADPAMGQFGAFLELLVDDRFRQLGDADKGLLQ